MIYQNLAAFKSASAARFGKGPFAMVIIEDAVGANSTLRHVLGQGFRRVIAAAPEDVTLDADIVTGNERLDIIRTGTRRAGITQDLVNALIDKAPGQWIHYCYNAEYLFFPFCEDRSVGEMITFVEEERRESILTYVIDLYADDLEKFPDAVSTDHAFLDSSGYFAETRKNEAGDVMDRQLNFFGGLRWRFEEHVSPSKRKIDRVGLFKAKPGLKLREDHCLNDEEYNTYSAPWHHSLSAAICSFRVAKALRTNPGSRHDVSDFRWHRSAPFAWSSQQLMELGLMEPGQWF